MVAEPDGRLGARLGAGREAEVYARGDAVIKVYRPGFGGIGPKRRYCPHSTVSASPRG